MKSLLIALPLFLSACASLPGKLEMSDEDRATCEIERCTAWSDGELRALIMEVQKEVVRVLQGGRRL